MKEYTNDTNTEVTAEVKQSNSLLSAITEPNFVNSLQQYLPKNTISADRMAKIILSDVRKNPKLMACDKMSFLASVATVAQLGLEIGAIGHCYLLPYYNNAKKITECQVIIGYKGLIDLVYRSEKVSTIQANVVDSADEFHFNFGSNPNIYHVPAREQNGETVYVYAIITFKDKSFQFVVLTMKEIEKIKSCSNGAKNSSTHPWHQWADEMMKKTALKRLFKYVPISLEVSQAISIDDTAESNFKDVSNRLDETSLKTTQKTQTEKLINEIN